VAVNFRQIFSSLWEGDRAAVMAETDAVSNGISPLCNIGIRALGRRTRVRAWVRARGAAAPRLWAFDYCGVFYAIDKSTPSGLKALAGDIKKYFEYLEKNSEHPDNKFQELAQLTGYLFPQYGNDDIAEEDAKTELFTEAIRSPEILNLIMRKSKGENVDDSEMGSEMIKLVATKPELASVFARYFMKSETSMKNIPKTKRQTSKR